MASVPAAASETVGVLSTDVEREGTAQQIGRDVPSPRYASPARHVLRRRYIEAARRPSAGALLRVLSDMPMIGTSQTSPPPKLVSNINWLRFVERDPKGCMCTYALMLRSMATGLNPR